MTGEWRFVSISVNEAQRSARTTCCWDPSLPTAGSDGYAKYRQQPASGRCMVSSTGVGDWVSVIPMAAPVAIMMMDSVGTFSLASIRDLHGHPRRSSAAMLATIAAVVFTHNLAIGVLLGALLSGLFFAFKVGQIFRVTSTLSPDGPERSYVVEG